MLHIGNYDKFIFELFGKCKLTFLLSRISAYGPGIEPFGPIVQTPANFTVETANAGKGILSLLSKVYF